MNKHISVPIPTDDFLELVDFLREKKIALDPVEAIRNAITYWIDSVDWKQEDMIRSVNQKPSFGYTWKYKDDSIFLPSGTKIRMFYKGNYYYAEVDKDQIIYEGNSVSPSLLANTITKSNKGLGSRNAWRDLWIKRPGGKEWVLADVIRKSTRDTLKELGI